jgi:hypothetical protein
MEFLTPKKKKQRARSLYTGYVLLGVLTLLATYVLIASARGYDLLDPSGNVVQNGLLFVNSRPSNADIYINGKKESNGTDAKLSLPDNKYDVTLKKQGYRDWSKSVNLFGGTVEFLTYPRLLPTTPVVVKTLALASQAAPESLQSHDKQFVALYDAGLPTAVNIYDISSIDSAPFVINVPDVRSLELLEWAADNVHLLAKVISTDGSVSYLELERGSTTTVNLTQLFSLPPTVVMGFWDAKWDKLYVYTPGTTVMTASVKDKSVSAQSLTSDSVVEFFPLTDNRFAYRTNIGGESVLKFYTDAKTYTVLPVADTASPLVVRSTRFNTNEFLIVAGGGLDKTHIYKNFETNIKKSKDGHVAPVLLIPLRSAVIESSTQGRFVLFSDMNQLVTYDFDRKAINQFDIGVAKPATIGWFDDSRIYFLGADQKLDIADFSGANRYELATNVLSIPMQPSDVGTSFFAKSVPGSAVLNYLDIKNPTK